MNDLVPLSECANIVKEEYQFALEEGIEHKKNVIAQRTYSRIAFDVSLSEEITFIMRQSFGYLWCGYSPYQAYAKSIGSNLIKANSVVPKSEIIISFLVECEPAVKEILHG